MRLEINHDDIARQLLPQLSKDDYFMMSLGASSKKLTKFIVRALFGALEKTKDKHHMEDEQRIEWVTENTHKVLGRMQRKTGVFN